MPHCRPLCFATAIAVLTLPHPTFAADRDVRFNRDIRPILSDRCFQCHGPDDKKREAGLRFDLAESAFQDLGGYHAVSKGEPDESELIARVSSDDPDVQMPPPESGKTISQDEVELLRRWIKQGAPFEEHWSFAPVRRPELPEIASVRWASNPVDRFIARKLIEIDVEPSPQADRETLIKRLSLDFTGLLPTPEEVKAFVADQAPNAYEKVVDRLLRSEHFGERFARHWLDLARYADSNGYANDGVRSIWAYRDWVIHALNDDMPFDQFTTEQLAGDLLPNATLDQRIATGFHRNTPHQTEGGSDPEQYRVERTKNRTDTTGAVWFGLTVGCAQCHTHKFDPISHTDYYQLYAFFNNADEPSLKLPTDEQSERIREVEQQMAALKRAFDEGTKQPVSKDSKANIESSARPEWSLLDFDHFKSTGGATMKRLDDGSILASGKNPKIDTYVLKAELEEPTQYLQLATLTHQSLPGSGPGRAGNGNFVLAKLDITVDNEPVTIIRSRADHEQSGYPIIDAVNGDTASGWAINVKGGNIHQNRHAYFELSKPVTGKLEIKMRTYDQGNGYNIGRLKWSAGNDSRLFPNSFDKHVQLTDQLNQLRAKKESIEKSAPSTLAMSERAKPRKSFVQLRGDFLDPGADVEPATLSVLHRWNPPKDRVANRLDLANWINDPANPLTARVQANRMWQHLFGVGLVETENDFGYQGSLPTHPELLDYLASELIDGGWKLKRIYKLIAMSETYRQASHYRQDAAEIDPKNQWLSRQRRYRVESEIVRDLALCSSGKLSRKIGGPSVFPPIPPGVIGTSSAKHSWPESKGDDKYRRGMYTTIYRANVYPMLTTFDGPDRDNACTRRSRSNTPLQALTMANDASLMELATAMAGRVLMESPEKTKRSRIEFAVHIGLCRTPNNTERQRLIQFFDDRKNFYLDNPSEAKSLVGKNDAELAAWTATCRLIMNLDEFITRE